MGRAKQWEKEAGQGLLCGWYSLALSLCISLGGCVETTQLCPVIRRNYKHKHEEA